jgi:hypothetical protein
MVCVMSEQEQCSLKPFANVVVLVLVLQLLVNQIKTDCNLVWTNVQMAMHVMRIAKSVSLHLSMVVALIQEVVFVSMNVHVAKSVIVHVMVV